MDLLNAQNFFLVIGFGLFFLTTHSLINHRSTIPASSQLITVISPSAESTSAMLRMYEKDRHGQWARMAKIFLLSWAEVD